MPGTASRPVPPLLTLPIRRRPLYACRFASSPSCLLSPNQSRPPRNFGTSPSPRDDLPNRIRDQPRWQSPPPRMVAPGPRLRENRNEFTVNDNPEILDRVLNKVLGKDGHQMLTEDVKWLAVTHKSFDHGRRGFNDRLAFFGKRIVELQASLRLLAGSATTLEPPLEDEFGRTPFKHPALEGLRGVTPERQELILNRARMAQLAQRYGLAAVLRWKPKHKDNLQGSGVELVLAQAMYAIIGAISLQKGGEVANRIVQERILDPLGLKS